MTLAEIRNRIAAIQTEVKGLDMDNLSNDDYAKLVALDTERKGLEADAEKAANVERIKADAKAHDARESTVSRLDVAPVAKAEVKSFGEAFMASASAKVKNVTSRLEVNVKTLMTTSAGVPVAGQGNQGVIVYQTTPKTTLLDALQTITVDNDLVGYRYYAEVLYTNNADTVAEGAQMPESALRLAEVTAGLYKVATWLPATDEQLKVAGAPEYIDSRIRTMVRSKAGAKALLGSGTNDVQGILNATGILTQAKGTDTPLDAIFKGITKVSDVGTAQEDFEGASVDLIVMHPTDWATLRLAKDSTGRYLLGDPAAAGIKQVWGVDVVLDKGMTVGTALALDTKFFAILLGEQPEVEQTNSHSDYFTKGINAIRCQMRMGMVPLRASAAVTITGLNS